MRTPSSSRRLVLVAAAVFALFMLALLAVQVVLLRQQLGTVREQLDIAQRQSDQAIPLLRAVRPLADDVRAATPEVVRMGRRADAALREARPLLAELRDARAGETLRGVSLLADALLRSDVGGATRAVRAMAEQVTAAQLPAGLAALLTEARTRDLLAKADRSSSDVRDVLELQRQALDLQRRSLAIQRRSLNIQRSTEAHAESLDRKTGGPLPQNAPAG